MEKEVFRAGTWTDARGREKKFTAKDVSEIASNFNNSKSENKEGYKVPLFLGHPWDESTAPALGWVERVTANGKSLFATFKDVSDTAKEVIAKKTYRDVSISIFNNILQHVGLTNTPAVAGLADFQYSAPHPKDSESFTFTTEDPNPKPGDNKMDLEKLTRDNENLKNQLSAEQKKVTDLEASVQEGNENFSKLEGEKKELETKLSAAEDKNKKLEDQLEADRKAVELSKDTAFVERLISEGRFSADKKQELITNLTNYPTHEMDVIENGEAVKKSAKDVYKDSLSKAAVILEAGEKFNNGTGNAKESELERLTYERMRETGEDYNTASLIILDENPALNAIG